jgi:hypothetical protein
MTVILSAVYVFGALSGKYTLGRVISYIVLLLHVAIADVVSDFELKMNRGHLVDCLRRWVVTAGVVAFSLFLSWNSLNVTLLRAFSTREPVYGSYLFLSRLTGQYDVILSDIRTSWIVPTFGGKVIAALHPLAFVPDHEIRKSDLKKLFDEETTLAERRRIIKKYGANYVLLNKLTIANFQEPARVFESLGKFIFHSDSFMLIAVGPMARDAR